MGNTSRSGRALGSIQPMNRIIIRLAVALMALSPVLPRGCPVGLGVATAQGQPVESVPSRPWLWSKAHAVPPETTSEQSGYFSIVEGRDGRVYIGTAKYGDNAFLVEFDPPTGRMRIVVDAEKEIGVDRKGFAAQAKFHTRNNVGPSGKIYIATKQGYPKAGEKPADYPGGHPMVYDPGTGKTRVYDIPVPHHGVISITPDESRGVAYISTCSDERPVESTHFMVLDLATGKYRDLLDCRHMYAFIVLDHLGRAYHPVLGGEIARHDPRSGKLERLRQTIDGAPPTPESLLAHPQSHPVNWEVSPDRRTLYSVAMSGNQLFAYDLAAEGATLRGRSLGKLVPDAAKTDCRALCVGPDGTVWAGVNASFTGRPDRLHLCRYRPGDPAPTDLGPIAISNPGYAPMTDASGKPLDHHHGVHRLADGTMLPRYVVMGICAASDGTVYLTTLYPFTLHAIRFPRVAGLTTTYYHNSHADMLLTRLARTDTMDGKGSRFPMRLASLYAEQVPEADMAPVIASETGIRRSASIREALLNPQGRLAVDGVLMIAEHGKYPESDTGQFIFPKRRWFTEIAGVMERAGSVAPVFCDKHLADNYADGKWIYDEARRLRIPLMAGSSVPLTWRYPPIDSKRGARLKQIVVTSHGRLDSYGIHALEAAQALAERRAGAETGVASVRFIEGKEVWSAAAAGLYDRALLDAALSRQRDPVAPGRKVEDAVPRPGLMVVDYRDGLRVCVFVLEGAVREWAAAWKEESGPVSSTVFWTQELRPFHHFSHQLDGIGRFISSGISPWPLERTLLTTGILDAVLVSKRDGGKIVATPWLDIKYQSDWNWSQPLPPPKGRPITGP